MVKEMIFIINKSEKDRGLTKFLSWIWEFSKKAVLICLTFYVIVQIYSMAVMVIFCDFSNLGILIEKTGDLVETCVFGYLIKAGFENFGKIWRNPRIPEDEEIAG